MLPDGDALRSRVPAALAGRSLCDYLAQRFRYLDRDRWRQQCRDGAILLGDRRAHGDERVRAGDTVTWLRPPPEPPVATGIGLLHVEDAFAVVDKPAHLPSHADGVFRKHTLVALLRERLGSAALSLVHRLDRETSGAMVVARTPAARAALQRQFERGAVHKRYLAVVRGVPVDDSFAIDAPIGRDPHSAIAVRRAVLPAAAPGAQPARTDCEVLQRLPDRALVRCTPQGGRTHQLRVHLCHAGHPILGDKLYGRSDADYLQFVQAMKRGDDPREAPPGQPSRQLLHASELGFAHPEGGQPLQFEAPLPDDLRAFL